MRFPVPTASKEDVRFFGELLESGRYRAVIDRRYSLERIVDAYKYVETGRRSGTSSSPCSAAWTPREPRTRRRRAATRARLVPLRTIAAERGRRWHHRVRRAAGTSCPLPPPLRRTQRVACRSRVRGRRSPPPPAPRPRFDAGRDLLRLARCAAFLAASSAASPSSFRASSSSSHSPSSSSPSTPTPRGRGRRRGGGSGAGSRCSSGDAAHSLQLEADRERTRTPAALGSSTPSWAEVPRRCSDPTSCS